MMNDKILIAKLRMIEAGVVPAFTGNDLVSMLKSLPRGEQKRAKRKFRKQWRKIMKNEPHTTDIFMKAKGEDPEKHHKRNRACFFVARMLESN